jgi:hypothetical protein
MGKGTDKEAEIARRQAQTLIRKHGIKAWELSGLAAKPPAVPASPNTAGGRGRKTHYHPPAAKPPFSSEAVLRELAHEIRQFSIVDTSPLELVGILCVLLLFTIAFFGVVDLIRDVLVWVMGVSGVA